MDNKKASLEDMPEIIKKDIHMIFEVKQIKLCLLKLDVLGECRDQHQCFVFSLVGVGTEFYYKNLFVVCFDKKTIYPALIYPVLISGKNDHYKVQVNDYLELSLLIFEILSKNENDIKKFVEQAECSLEAELAYKNTLEAKLLACMSLLKKQKRSIKNDKRC